VPPPDSQRGPSLVRLGFDRRAAHYDNPWTAFVGERELRQIRPFVPPGSEVLDYGCGTGRTTLDLLRRGCRVTAYDISAAMLAQAQAKAQAAGFASPARVVFTADVGELAGRTWPVVTLIGVLDYYPDPQPLLRTVGQYLTPGGRLVVTYPNAASPLGWLYALGSRFTVPARPRQAAFARQAAIQAGFCVAGLRYAFPALPVVGYTLVLALERREDLCE
jgi:2-polyprenyl-3-methyl-5-hydroxy-6-metoxy-1,4-benzoquinol methylase